MASHVIVLDSTARTFKIKTTPDKPIYEIRDEACAKFGREPSRYVLKHKNKDVDHSRKLRLSGLVAGAKLDLIASSRSPSPISVALQLPEAEPNGTSRLTEKFSSNTSIWLILRHFESEAPTKRNFTARSAPAADSKSNGASRLYYETPIVQAGGRELSSFPDLQKSPASLGVNSGSMLLRLRFHQTDRPLEEAMTEISHYFDSANDDERANNYDETFARPEPLPTTPDAELADQHRGSSISGQSSHSTGTTPIATQPSISGPSAADNPASIAPTSTVNESEVTTGPGQRSISIFAPPMSSTPQAVQYVFDEADFEPTPDHMRSHQYALQKQSQNRRLATDAELEAQAEAQRQKLANIRSVQIKVRFPDESQVAATFTDKDTVATLCDHVRGLLQQPDEPFLLTFRTGTGTKVLQQSSDDCLIGKLGMTGRVLVNFSWEQNNSIDARMKPTLKEEYRLKAQPIPIQQPEHAVVNENAHSKPTNLADRDKGKRKEGVPKWLKLPGRK